MTLEYCMLVFLYISPPPSIQRSTGQVANLLWENNTPLTSNYCFFRWKVCRNIFLVSLRVENLAYVTIDPLLKLPGVFFSYGW